MQPPPPKKKKKKKTKKKKKKGVFPQIAHEYIIAESEKNNKLPSIIVCFYVNKNKPLENWGHYRGNLTDNFHFGEGRGVTKTGPYLIVFLITVFFEVPDFFVNMIVKFRSNFQSFGRYLIRILR